MRNRQDHVKVQGMGIFFWQRRST